MKYTSDDPYTDTETGVLKNRLGLKKQETLDQYEAAFAFARSVELSVKPIKGNFDLEHLKAIHKQLFCDVYEWAGNVRTVDISKGENRFANAHHIESYAPKISKALEGESHLKNLPPKQFAERAAYYMGELNVLHPFREGNGRALREFMGQLAKEAGYEIHWNQMTQDEMVKASIAAFHGDHRPLFKLIHINLHDIDHDRALEIARHVLGDKVKITRPRENVSYCGDIIGTTDRYVVQVDNEHNNEVILHQKAVMPEKVEELAKNSVDIHYTSDGVCEIKADEKSQSRDGYSMGRG